MNTAPATGTSLVALAPSVAGDYRAAGVERFVQEYFTAINDHSFAKFRVLLDPQLQQNETAPSFRAGYRSTADSNALITAINPASPGLLGVSLTFVSHQRPSDSATGTACTDWHITLFLQDYSGRYLIGPAPTSYHAAYRAC